MPNDTNMIVLRNTYGCVFPEIIYLSLGYEFFQQFYGQIHRSKAKLAVEQMIEVASCGHFVGRVEEQAMPVVKVLEEKVCIDADAVLSALVGELGFAPLPLGRNV